MAESTEANKFPEPPLQVLVNSFLEKPSALVKTLLIEMNDSNQNSDRKSDELEEEVEGCASKIQVVDETAVLESLSASKNDATRGKLSRRKRRALERALQMEMDENVLNRVDDNICDGNGEGMKSVRAYSRKEMMRLRFVDIQDQKRKWYEVYCGLGIEVSKEYDCLIHSAANQKQKKIESDRRKSGGKKEKKECFHGDARGEGASEEVSNDKEMNLMETVGPSGIAYSGEDGYTGLEEECSEEGDTDEDYDSILRPAFYVEGEPDFDSGPPEDGLEYLRRVRWEAAQIPKVKVAHLDKGKISKEQTDYMPRIPDITQCPDNLLPSKEWEEIFLADFLELRLTISRLEASDITSTGELSEEYPTMSAILRMDSVARVSLLRRRIAALETLNTLTKANCAWLFALCAAVDTPLHANTCASMRCLLRKCASMRAEKSEMDDEVAMLNVVATISGKYFKQSED